jgi:hypothetical protein
MVEHTARRISSDSAGDNRQLSSFSSKLYSGNAGATRSGTGKTATRKIIGIGNETEQSNRKGNANDRSWPEAEQLKGI